MNEDGGLMASDRKVVQSKRGRKVSWSAAAFVLLAVCLLSGSGVLSTAHSHDKIIPSEIRARRFVVVDGAGNERGEFGISPSGLPAVRLWDERKTVVSKLEIDQMGMPRLAFETSAGASLIDFGILERRHPVFILGDADGNRRLGMVVGQAGAVDIALYDTHKQNRCAVSLTPDGDPQILLRDKKGQVRASFMLDDTGTSAVDLFDRKGKERIVFQVDAQGEADAVVFAPDGKAAWSGRRP